MTTFIPVRPRGESSGQPLNEQGLDALTAHQGIAALLEQGRGEAFGKAIISRSPGAEDVIIEDNEGKQRYSIHSDMSPVANDGTKTHTIIKDEHGLISLSIDSETTRSTALLASYATINSTILDEHGHTAKRLESDSDFSMRNTRSSFKTKGLSPTGWNMTTTLEDASVDKYSTVISSEAGGIEYTIKSRMIRNNIWVADIQNWKPTRFKGL